MSKSEQYNTTMLLLDLAQTRLAATETLDVTIGQLEELERLSKDAEKLGASLPKNYVKNIRAWIKDIQEEESYETE